MSEEGLLDTDGELQGPHGLGHGHEGVGKGGLCREQWAVARQRDWGRGPRRAGERGWEPGPGLLPQRHTSVWGPLGPAQPLALALG